MPCQPLPLTVSSKRNPPLKWNLSMTGNLRCFKLYRTHVIIDEYGGNRAFNSYDENTTLYVPVDATCYEVSDWVLFFQKIGYTL